MTFLAVPIGLLVIAVVLWDAFETMVLPRRVTRTVRLTRLFFRATWGPGSWLARRLAVGARREDILSLFGPLALILLFAVWAAALIAGFALLHLGLGTEVTGRDSRPGFGPLLYMSGETFFTLGFG